jgi:hypothetical protein
MTNYYLAQAWKRRVIYGAVGWLLLIAALPVFLIVTLTGLS